MPILAIETATMVSSVALSTENRLLGEIILQTRLTHSEILMPHIEKLLLMTKTEKKDLDAIAVSIGPGSFTGLRIGLAAAKSMAYVLNIPLIGISTMDALAAQYPVPNLYVVPALDAQKGNVYTSLYEWAQGSLCQKDEIRVSPFTEVLEACKQMDKKVVLVGDIAQKYGQEIKEAGDPVFAAPPYLIMPRAATLADLAWKRLQDNKVDSVMNLEPVYVRRSEAEVLWEKRQKAMQA